MPRSSVLSALELPPEQVGPAIVAVVEDQWFDRKSGQIAPAKLAVTEVALANADGGTIVIGIEDGRVDGTDGLAKHRNDLIQAGIDHCEPPVRSPHRLVPCVNAKGGHDHLLVIDVPPSEVVHTLKNDDCYLRVGDEDRRLRFRERQELIFDKGQAHFDGTVVPHVGLEHLHHRVLREYLERVGARDTERTLHARLLLTAEGAVTAGGYLLFGAHPQDHFPEAYVRVLRYLGVERPTGSRQNVLDADVRCEAPSPW